MKHLYGKMTWWCSQWFTECFIPFHFTTLRSTGSASIKFFPTVSIRLVIKQLKSINFHKPWHWLFHATTNLSTSHEMSMIVSNNQVFAVESVPASTFKLNHQPERTSAERPSSMLQSSVQVPSSNFNRSSSTQTCKPLDKQKSVSY